MTKIKDLVTVIADSAFSQFPINLERYELEAAMAVYGTCERTVLGSYSHSDERVNAFLKSTDEVLLRNATSWAMYWNLAGQPTSIDEDRAARVTASLDRYVDWWSLSHGDHDVVDACRRSLWRCLFGAMQLMESACKGRVH